MTNYDYIMTQCRRFRSSKWDETELRRCKELLKTLSREELLNVYRSRFLMDKHSPVIPSIMMTACYKEAYLSHLETAYRLSPRQNTLSGLNPLQ